MNSLQQAKIVNILPPGAIVDNADFVTAAIDTAGFGKCAVFFTLGATDIAMTALKLQQSDDSGMSGAADITGAVYGASGAPALPSATDDNKVYAFHVSLQGKRRYLDLVATAGNGSTGTYGSAVALLYNGNDFDPTATDQGVAGSLVV
ncbi:hypothetical protein UFOVP422_12 [uncultured Caudovirales phage]|uniref:Uncharacterized protein n=1 Tax=uncultured Caudovirales phage TaxID=2100421 RepID=A0A6J5M530_9CAUD|nr:hypothetical protein UFOVP422_12 [uncultured Caudovirales phage]